jgi:tetratricopeptide (TPR) repeat protein/tRNA A-37 threonylcarbamoyl transferase component Bud32
MPVDTTGLPPGATFGPSTRLNAAVTVDGLTRAIVHGTVASSLEPAVGPLRVGQSFGPRYHIIKVLGVGGMGAVYQAWDAELGVAVALKVIRTDRRHQAPSPDAERRFKQELLLARQVTHKNVVRIHDINEIDGIKYITMPFIHGSDLATVLRESGKLPLARALRIARQIASGLQAAPAAGVVHRDLKPANVMIGAENLALIMDFGISASADAAADGGIVGTLEYMAPEQGTGAAVDQRADIYAFGLILSEMLTGPRPITATTLPERVAAMRERTTTRLPSLRSLDPTITEPIDKLVARCVALDPADRFRTSADLCAALARIDDAGALLPAAPRARAWMVGTAVAAVAALLAVAFALLRPTAAPTPHDPVSIVIADLQNGTGDSAFDGTLEPMLKIALESAGFISAYDRNGIVRSLGVRPPATLDERGAQELAVKQGLGVVVSGVLDHQKGTYQIAMKATQAVTGTVIANARGLADSKEDVLGAATKLAAQIRRALGDNSSDRFAMETLSATSLDVVHDYAAAAQAMSNARYDEARDHFAQAVQRDPNFGLAYAGLAIASRNLDRQQDAERYIKQAISHLDGMTERERYRTRGLFYMITGDHQQCVKEFGDLIGRFAADASARNNLALCLTGLRSLPRAVDEMRQVVKILPKRALYRENLALYADYSGDADAAEREVRAMADPSVFGLLALAYSQLLRGQVADAIETYHAIGKVDALGASYMASGLGDVALYEGRISEAVRILENGAAADLASKDADRAADKFAALAGAQLLRGQPAAAISAAERALANSQAVKIRFLTARVMIEAGDAEKARPLAASLASALQAEPQAYAKLLDGEALLKAGDARQAIARFTEGNALLDTWIGHFDLGRAFLAAGAFTSADSEFDRCVTRRGEALALFLDEQPTYGYFPVVYYYQGRVREGLDSTKFADSYRVYLSIRNRSTEDPLVGDAQRRVAGR